MTTRLIDAMCDYHRSWTVENRMWRDHILCTRGCRTVMGVSLLPHLNSAQQLAIHEAGHAVVYLAIGDRVLWATADASIQGHPGGEVKTDPRVDGRGVLAGAAAVARWAAPTSHADVVDIANGARHDFANVWNAGVGVGDAAWLLREADGLVASHWSSIERVADALLASGRLTGDEIAALAGITCNA